MAKEQLKSILDNLTDIANNSFIYPDIPKREFILTEIKNNNTRIYINYKQEGHSLHTILMMSTSHSDTNDLYKHVLIDFIKIMLFMKTSVGEVSSFKGDPINQYSIQDLIKKGL